MRHSRVLLRVTSRGRSFGLTSFQHLLTTRLLSGLWGRTMGSYLDSLNPAQLKAVQHPPSIPLQILAGPGSGKTKVLTSRIAHLIRHHAISPSSICAVTFTNKAANEMRERLIKLIGKHETVQVKMGTFHALCAMFLRKYSNLVGVDGNFTVCDADESKKIVTKLLKPHEDELAAQNITLKEGTVLSLISKAKAQGHTPEEYFLSLKSQKVLLPEPVHRLVAEIYGDYTKILRRNNSLDFDDLLCYGVNLFRGNSWIVDWCQHVLVDEFQDTNTMQYELTRCISAANKCLTIVGDPDQSIYGWRSAEVANLGKMRKDFPTTEQIMLEHNYRSTQSILEASLAIVAQDKTRIPKLLHSSHPSGPFPVLHSFPTENAEAAFVAAEIKRIVAHMGGMLTWNDFAVLLRFNALSRAIESALQKEGIPNRVLGGHKFFERLEIKDILAYLHLMDNPLFAPAFIRVVNVPPRGIGEKTITAVIVRADAMKISPLEVVNQIYDGKIPDIKPAIKNKIGSFVQPIRILTKMADDNTSPSDLICRLLELIEYEAHLKKSQQDWESKWENVQELLTFAREVESRLDEQASQTSGLQDAKVGEDLEREIVDYWVDDQHELEVDETESFDVVVSGEGKKDQPSDQDRTSPLRAFLQASMLSTGSESQEDGVSNDKVTISTCHTAKGLEWPVVMVPAVEHGTFPSHRADDIEEERRLLYVACTRAQGLLYLTHSTRRMFAGQAKRKELSPFVSAVLKENEQLFTVQPNNFDSTDRALLAAVCNLPVPNEAEVRKRVDKLERANAIRLGVQHDSGSSYVVQLHEPQPSHIDCQPTSRVFSRQAVAPSPASPTRRPPATFSPANSVNLTPPFLCARAETVSREKILPHYTPRRVLEQSDDVSSQPPKTQSAPTKHQQHTAQNTYVQPPLPGSAVARSGTKRRLGMGRGPVGYFPNKKFKPPT